MRILKTNFTLKNGKKGVALITVLLFMMMATIAATAVHKWLISENRASAARLKQNEAYQASQAGINAARAWLSYNGNETAALVTQFLNGDKTPILLNQLITPFETTLQQRDSVKLVDVDTSSRPIAIKIISKGIGRDYSEYSQVAILKVDGLYRIPIPAEAASIDYNYAYFGGTTAFAGGHAATSMLINGNWSGNPGNVAQDFIVTGNSSLSGDNITVGGYACIGGDFDAGNGSTTKHLYVAGNAGGKLRSITGNAYFESEVDIGASDLNVNGNIFVNGLMQTNLNQSEATFQGNFCLSNDAHIMFNGTNKTFKVEKNIWIPNEGGISGEAAADIDSKNRRIFGNNSESEVYISEAYYDGSNSGSHYYHQEGSFMSNLWGMITGDFNWRYFSTKSDNLSKTTTGNPPFSCASEVKEYCETKWHNAKGEGCDGSDYKVDDMLTTAYSSFEQYANNSTCTQNIHDVGMTDFVGTLNGCYEELNTPENKKNYLYNGFLVVKLSHNQLANPTGTLNGKFIFIYDEALGQQNFPPTTSNSVVMLYLNKGGTGEIMQQGSGTYNYFIYTKGDIEKIKGSNWNGSVYATAANCAKLKSMEKVGGGDSEFLQFDPEIIKILTSAKVICAAGHRCGDSSDSDAESGDASSNTASDPHWIALAPTLKIDLASQYINDEFIDTTEGLNPSLLVMPRILYMNVGEQLVNETTADTAYNVLYLGGLQPPGFGSARCYQGPVCEDGTSMQEETSPFTERGLYCCLYTEGNKACGTNENPIDCESKFWVWVADVDESSKVAFREGNVSLAKKCKDFGQKEELVYLDLASGTKVMPGKLLIRILSSATGAHYSALSSAMFSLNDVDGDGKTWELTFPNTTPALTSISDPLFKVTIDGSCADAFGDVNFYMIDDDPTDGLGIGHPNSETIELSPASGIVIHKPIEEYTGSNEKVLDFMKAPDCDEPMNQGEHTFWAPTSPLCETVENDFDNFAGGWRCDLGTQILMAVSNDDGYNYNDGCVLVQDSVVLPYVESMTEKTYAYASLKKKPYHLYVKVEGMMGKADNYESKLSYDDVTSSMNSKTEHLDDNEYMDDVEISILNENDSLMGTCKTGRRGECDFIIYHGKTYYAVAKGEYFDHWSYNCESCKHPKTDGCSCNIHTTKNYIAIKALENDTIQANYTRKGVCFNESFEHLYSYCDYEVTPEYVGGYAAQLNSSENINNSSQANINETLEMRQNFLRDAARKQDANGNTAYCIDQCVTTPGYRYSEKETDPNGGKKGAPATYKYFFDTYCSVEENKDIPEEMTVEEKEKEENDYWSYYDQGVSCKNQIKRRLEWSQMDVSDYKWVFDPAETFKYSYTEANGNKWCDANGENNNHYRCTGKACESNSHPKDIPAPRIKGGYYRQDDIYSPWLKVMMNPYSQHAKMGPRHDELSSSVLTIDGVAKKHEGVVWNVKPLIHRDGSNSYMTVPWSASAKKSFVILRKQEAGYNGTYTEDFTWNGSGESNDGGSFAGIVFRSNADASSYFILGINPSSNTGSTTESHFILCHGNERLTYNESAVIVSNTKEREIMNPYNYGHCITENVKDENNNNIPWDYIKQRSLRLIVDLDEDSAHVKFSYSNNKFTATPGAPEFENNNMTIYVKKSFCLTCSEDFGYPIYVKDYVNPYDPNDIRDELTVFKYDPIERMDKKKNKYVGFVPHNPNKKVYNLNWRSGGSCGSDYQGKQTGVYCAFDNPNVKPNESTIPIRYVYDFCPDKGECTYEFYYSVKGRDWVPEAGLNAELTLDKPPVRYPKGALKIMAIAKDDVSGEQGTFYADCEGFFTTTGDDKCTDNFLLFNQYSAGDATVQNKLISQFESHIFGPDNWYLNNGTHNIENNIRDYASTDYAGNPNKAIDIRKKLCMDEDGSDHYRANAYCSSSNATGTSTHTPNTTTYPTSDNPYHPKVGETENRSDGKAYRNSSYLKIAKNQNGDPEPGIVENYIQLVDTIDGGEYKIKYLNLSNSTLSFEMLQVALADEIKVWLVDEAGKKSGEYIVPGVEATLNRSGDYCNVNDDRITKDEYNHSPESYPDYYQELCQINLLWVRDVKRLRRKIGYSSIHLYVDVAFSVNDIAYSLDADEGFNPQRVSKIYFSVKNSRGGGIYISKLQNSCATALDVKDCAINNLLLNDVTVNEGTMVPISATVAGTSECKIDSLPGNANYTLLHGTSNGQPFEFGKYYTHNSYNGTDGNTFNVNLVTECEATGNVQCEAKFQITCKNASDDEKSCKTSKTLKVKNTTANCYASNKASVVYDGIGNLSLGAGYNNYYQSQIDAYLVFTDEATQTKSIVEHFVVNGSNNPTGCKVNSSGATRASGYANCSYFEFKPTKSGTYTIAYGKDNQYVESDCKMDVEVPERALHSCVWNQNPLGGGVSVTASATGAYLSREGKLTLTKGGTTIENGCTFNTDDGIVSCGFSTPMQNGSYSAEISFNDKTTPCENLVVASKPYPKDCKISDFGIFNAHIENLTKGMSYHYRLVVCKDMLGMGCTVDHGNYQTTMEGTDVSFSPTIKPSFENGKTYNYVFEVSVSGDFEKDKESCVPEPEVKHQFENNPNSAECRFATTSIRKGANTRIVVTNIKGITSDRVMEVRNANGDKAGTVIVNANGTPSAEWDYRNKVEIGMATKSGKQTYSVYDGEKLVCTADIDVLPITASSCKIVEVNNTNNEVTKGIAKTNVKFRADGISIGNITADFTAKAKRPGGGEKDVRLTPYNTTAVSEGPQQLDLPDLTGEVAYTLYDPSGDVICTTPAVEVLKITPLECKVANDDEALGNKSSIMASNSGCQWYGSWHCPYGDTHFYFYYKAEGNPSTTLWVRSYAWFDVGADPWSSVNECDAKGNEKTPPGYKCIRIDPRTNGRDGFKAGNYRYRLTIDYSGYYGNPPTAPAYGDATPTPEERKLLCEPGYDFEKKTGYTLTISQ